LSAKSANDRIAQIHAIRKIIASAPNEGGAWTGPSTHPLWLEDKITPPMPEEFVLLGDFNLAPRDMEYQHLLRTDDHECKLLDSWSLAGRALHVGVTYPANPKGSQRIDFAFVGKTMQNQLLGARIDAEAQGSDHQPYWIEL
jgi:endonuclease/exonuclease/phosphatase family metal-dependent hydrolase